MSKRKITDHAITGKQTLAIARTQDRSLDSLISPKDKRILSHINKNADALWAEVVAKRQEQRLAKQKVVEPRELTPREKQILKVIDRKEKRLLEEITLLEQQGKKRVAMNRRMHLNQTREKKKNLLKGAGHV
jgi:hypothetical protein